MSETRRVGQQRPGGRSARVRAAVLTAASELLREAGYDAFSIEEVAARAGVHKTTVYRRWPTKADLIADTSDVRRQQLVPIPDTGSLAGDLRALARVVADNLGSELEARMTRTRIITAAAAKAPDAAAGTAALFSEPLALADFMFDRAVIRGELSPDADRALIIQTLTGPLYVQLLLTGEPVDSDFADRVAILLTAGVHWAPGKT